MKNTDEFKQLLWRAGFVTTFAGQTVVDKTKACEYLECSRRTLDRWLNGINPCPRAVRLLKLQRKILPKSWKGFYFDRGERLQGAGFEYGLSPKDVSRIPQYVKDGSDAATDARLLREYMETIQDSATTERVRKQLLSVTNQLTSMLADPLFDQRHKIERATTSASFYNRLPF